MPREIKWSPKAIREWVAILEYWKNRNKSDSFGLKLDELLAATINNLIELPESGTPTDYPLVRTKLVRDYTIYYRVRTNHIDILSIWDSRRDPKKFKL